MEIGTIVEYIDRKRVVSAVVTQVKKQKLLLLTEQNREVAVSEARVFCPSGSIDLGLGRDRISALLAEIGRSRETLKVQVSITDLWEILHGEGQWVDIETMAGLAFAGDPDADRISATIRALLDDRVHFRFDVTRFFPNSPDTVEQKLAALARDLERERLIENAVRFLKGALKDEAPQVPAEQKKAVELLKKAYVFEKDFADFPVARQIMAKAGIAFPEELFSLLIRLSAFDENENIELLRLRVPLDFPAEALAAAEKLAASPGEHTEPGERRDLTSLAVLTIDGQATADFDDGLSIESDGDIFRVGIHIADVAHFIRKGSRLDGQAAERASSIYMPDRKIPMLPHVLAEGLLSLKADCVKPAVSILAQMDADANVLSYEVCASLIRVRRQLTYHEANLMAGADKEIIGLLSLAEKLKQKRLANGALIITLPEVNVYIDEGRQVSLHRINRESASRFLVSELMILANRLMAEFLEQKKLPAVFRSQPEPKTRLFAGEDTNLCANWLQRRHLPRFVLSPWPERHACLGLPAYLTATSPIRKYFDLVTQRQVKAGLGLREPYTEKELEEVLMTTQPALSKVARVQQSRLAYWTLAYLAGRIGSRENALCLERRRDRYILLLTDPLVETSVPASGLDLAPETPVTVRIDRVNPRTHELAVSLASIG